MYKSGDFNPRSPCGERRVLADFIIKPAVFQSTLSLRRATWTLRGKGLYSIKFQSTLSLRRATGFPNAALRSEGFQSTLSLRRATVVLWRLWKCPVNFNPRSPCGERRHRRCAGHGPPDFNPRSPCGERPRGSTSKISAMDNFNPRSPCGERPGNGMTVLVLSGISIHALLAESDSKYHQIGPIVSV